MEDGFREGSFGVCREEAIVDDKLMKVVFEVIAALVSAVAIVNCKKLSFDTFLFYIKSNANSILVIIPRYSLMSIDRIALNEPILFL